MKFGLKFKFYIPILFLSLSNILLPGRVSAQDLSPTVERDTLLSAAREYMHSARFCALITIDESGSSHARTMDPFDPDENMIVWLGTNRNSRKVREIKNNPNVTLFYTQNKGVGYVSIIGNATIVDDKEKKSELWKNEWKNFYDKGKENYVLIKVVPARLELLNFNLGISGDKYTWKTPAVEFDSMNNEK